MSDFSGQEHSEIAKTGVCRIKKRVSLFKKVVFEITGIWDYDYHL